MQRLIVVALASLIGTVAAGQGADTFSGSGVVIGTHGEVLTNAHVVENCTKITVRSPSGCFGGAFWSHAMRKTILPSFAANSLYPLLSLSGMGAQFALVIR